MARKRSKRRRRRMSGTKTCLHGVKKSGGCKRKPGPKRSR